MTHASACPRSRIPTRCRHAPGGWASRLPVRSPSPASSRRGLPWVQRLGLSALTLAIVFGIAAGNTFFPAIAARTAVGVDFSKSTLLRAGIILFGLRITFQQIAAVGWAGVIIDALMVGLTFVIAVLLGTRVLRLDRQTSMLIGAGSALCGAAAVMATEPVVRAQAHKVSVAVATVVVFGTLGMFAYPLLYPLSGHVGTCVRRLYRLDHSRGGAGGCGRQKRERAGRGSGRDREDAAHHDAGAVSAGAVGRRSVTGVPRRRPTGTPTRRPPIVIPWFAVLFIVASAVNSLHFLPARLVAVLIDVDTVLLATAMAALGLRTHAGAIRQAGRAAAAARRRTVRLSRSSAVTRSTGLVTHLRLGRPIGGPSRPSVPPRLRPPELRACARRATNWRSGISDRLASAAASPSRCPHRAPRSASPWS